jgi:hypothetical protein
VICVTSILVGVARRRPEANYAARMAGWRDARVLAAEEALDAAVRTADDVIAAVARRDDEPPTAPEPEQRSVLRDAW